MALCTLRAASHRNPDCLIHVILEQFLKFLFPRLFYCSYFITVRWVRQAASFSQLGASACGVGVGRYRQGCIPKALWCWRMSFFQKMCMAHSQVYTWMVSHAVFQRPREVGFAFSHNIWFPWCLIPTLCWHSHAHRNTRWCQPQEWGPLGDN